MDGYKRMYRLIDNIVSFTAFATYTHASTVRVLFLLLDCLFLSLCLCVCVCIASTHSLQRSLPTRVLSSLSSLSFVLFPSIFHSLDDDESSHAVVRVTTRVVVFFSYLPQLARMCFMRLYSFPPSPLSCTCVCVCVRT